MSAQFVRVQNCQLELHENSVKIDDIAITLVGKKPTLLLRYRQQNKREYKVPSSTYYLAASCYQHLLIEYVLVMCYQSRAVHFDVRPPLISIRTPETLLQKCELTMQCQQHSRICFYSQTVGLYVYALLGCSVWSLKQMILCLLKLQSRQQTVSNRQSHISRTLSQSRA